MNLTRITLAAAAVAAAAITLAAPAHATAAPTTLYYGHTLSVGGRLTSPDSRSVLVVQGDGNAVVYTNGHATWQSGTRGRAANPVLGLQSTDGNIVLRSGPTGSAAWASMSTPTNGVYPSWRLVMQNDGNLVAYAHLSTGDVASWSSRYGIARHRTITSTSPSCATAVAYLNAHAAPGFDIHCPIPVPAGVAAETHWAGHTEGSFVAIGVGWTSCAAGWMNEAANSQWIYAHRNDRDPAGELRVNGRLDPFGKCYG